MQENTPRMRDRNREKTEKSPLTMQTRKNYGTVNLQDAAQPSAKKRLNTRWVSGILTMLLSLTAGAFTFLPQFRIVTPNVMGGDQVNLEEITYYTGLRALPVYRVDPDVIREVLLKRFPEARDIKVFVELPNRVDIVLEQRVPIIEWDFGGSKFWLDEESTVIKETNFAGDVIYVLANSFPGAQNKNDRKIPNKFSKQMLKSVLEINQAKPEGKTLFYTYENGYGWMTDKGYSLWLGMDSSNLAEKMAMAASLSNYFVEKEIEPDMLSLEFPRAPYYRFAE